MPKKFWIAALAITIIYWGTYQGFEGLKFFKEISPLIKHLVSFLLLFLVFIIGSVTFYSVESKRWLKKLWDLSYVVVGAILVLFGTIDILSRIESQNVRELFANLRLFFTSPVPFGIIAYLGRKSKN